MKKLMLLLATFAVIHFASAGLLREESFKPIAGVGMRPVTGGRLTLPTFGGATVTFELGERQASVTGCATYPARSVGSAWHDASLVITSNGFVLRTQSADGCRLAFVWNGVSVKVRESSAPKGGHCGTCAKHSAKSRTSSRVVAGVSGTGITGDPLIDGAGMLKGERCTNLVDVLIVLDASAKDWVCGVSDFAETDDPCGAYAADAINRANQSLANTDLDKCFRFRLAGLLQIGCDCSKERIVEDGSNNVNSEKLLDCAIEKSGTYRNWWKKVADERERVRADVVSIHVSCGSEGMTGTVGIGAALGNEQIVDNDFPDKAYNVCLVESVASDVTMTHEIGHNMGAGHAEMKDTGNSGPQLYDYSTGYYFDATNRSGDIFRHCATVMAYDSDGYCEDLDLNERWGEPPEWVPAAEKELWSRGMFVQMGAFSSAAHTYRYADPGTGEIVETGIPLGDEKHDNTKLLSKTYPLVANYRVSDGATLLLDYPAGGAAASSTRSVLKSAAKTFVKAVAKPGYLFAGWYRSYDDATGEFSDPYMPDDGDYRDEQFVYEAEIGDEGDMTLYGRFVKLDEDRASIGVDIEDYYTTGVRISPIAVDTSACLSIPKVTVTGLPRGLVFDPDASLITGTPVKSGIYHVTASVTTAGRATASVTLKMIVVSGNETVLDIGWDENGGKVTGEGVYAPGKTVKLTAKAAKGYVFTGYYLDDELISESATFRFTAPESGNIWLTAGFVTLEEELDSLSVVADGSELIPGEPLSVELYVGVMQRIPVEVYGCTATKVKVTGLPTGLKFTAKDIYVKGSKTVIDVPANTIYGIPTKAKTFSPKVTVTTAGKQKAVYPLDLEVMKLPDGVVGSFSTSVIDQESEVVADAAFKVSSLGKISGSFVDADGMVWKFTAKGFSEVYQKYFTAETTAECTVRNGARRVKISRNIVVCVCGDTDGEEEDDDEDGGDEMQAYILLCREE